MKTSSESRIAYIARTAGAREFAGKKQEEIADFLGINRATYTSYESRRALPQRHIAKFCEITGVTEKWLLTGEGPKTLQDDFVYLMQQAARDPENKAALQAFALRLMVQKQ